MTLIWQLMIGAGVILIVSGLENISLTCTVEWVWNGAGSTPPSGCTPSSLTGNTSTSTVKSITTA